MRPFFPLPRLLALLGLGLVPVSGYSQGFASLPLLWPTPPTAAAGPNAIAAADGFNALQREVAPELGVRSWDTADLNGDGRPDLVVTSEGNGRMARVLGYNAVPHWDVYLGTGAGFAATPVAWSLPASALANTGLGMGDPTVGFLSLEQPHPDAHGRVWSMADLNGDGRPDLVVTGESDGQALSVVGYHTTPRWDVFLNTGTGFTATPLAWPVPANSNAGGPYASWRRGFFSLFSPLSNVTNAWHTLDLNGDARPDLVVTGIIAPNAPGTHPLVPGVDTAPHWDVYLNTGAGFAAAPLAWPVPDNAHAAPSGAVVTGFSNLTSEYGTTGRRRWHTRDMNADARPDLVVTGELAAQQPVVLNPSVLGTGSATPPHWDVFLNTGAGFAATPVAWAVPPTNNAGPRGNGFFQPAYAGNSFYSPVQLATEPTWDTADLTGDGRPDLVVSGASDGTAFAVLAASTAPHWDVYPGTSTGFAAVPVAFAVPANAHAGNTPAGTATRGFYRFSQPETSWVMGARTWASLDMDGDRRPDLAVLSEGNGTRSPVLGGGSAPHWEVFLNQGLVSATQMPRLLATSEVYPNPTAGALTLRTAPALRGTPYRLLDALGRVQATGTVQSPEQHLDLRAVAAGVYTLQLLAPAPQHLRVVKE